jgi:hypothetical protein
LKSSRTLQWVSVEISKAEIDHRWSDCVRFF